MQEVTTTINKQAITKEQGFKLLSEMYLIRRFEEKAAEMYSNSKIRGFLHLCVGEEAVSVGLMQALKKEDKILSTYREHGHALARGLEPGAIMAEMYGKKEGCSKGRGGSMHIFDVSKNFYGGNAIVAGHLPVSVGIALAIKKQNQDAICCCIFGEGAMAEGEFHETMNLASLWEVPLLLVCENNQYAMGTALRYSHSMTDLEKKADSYAIASAAVDGMDVMAVMNAATEAVEMIRKTGKPFFLVCNTYRFRAHSMFDAELYRDKAEVETWKKRDPIILLRDKLVAEKLITDDEIKIMESEVEKKIQLAVDFAEAGTWEDTADLTKYLYSK